MATYKTEEVVRGLDTAFEPDVFTVRIVKNEKQKSGTGNPMVVTSIEVIDPPSARAVGGKGKVALAGTKIKLYGMLNPSESWGLGKLLAGLKAAGLSPASVMELEEGVEFDDSPEQLNKYVGKCFRMTLLCEQRPLMKVQSPEDKAAGLKKEQAKDAAGNLLYNGYQIKADWQQVAGPAIEGAGENTPDWA